MPNRHTCESCGFVGNAEHMIADLCPDCIHKMKEQIALLPDPIRRQLWADVYVEALKDLLAQQAEQIKSVEVDDTLPGPYEEAAYLANYAVSEYDKANEV